ncbi:hypothetical protein [Actinomadura madurae]|uniref:hypothetical protein n=1 Tax=Actinomadura madurae TaxID=1993 RepID=UPI003FD838EB
MVTLNEAVALAMVDGPSAGLDLLRTLDGDARMSGHHRLAAVRAHLLEMAATRAPRAPRTGTPRAPRPACPNAATSTRAPHDSTGTTMAAPDAPASRPDGTGRDTTGRATPPR